MALFAFPLARGLSVGGLSWSQSSLWQPSLVIAPICHGHSPNTNTLPHHKLSILNTQSAQDNRNPFPAYNSSLNYFLRLEAACLWMRTTFQNKYRYMYPHLPLSIFWANRELETISLQDFVRPHCVIVGTIRGFCNIKRGEIPVTMGYEISGYHLSWV